MANSSANLDYHRFPQPGKITLTPSKPCSTQAELSMAYSPGVADPCREIAAHPETAFDYTSRGNMVAVVSDGTAVLGLGNIGPAAGLPVMEGKAVLFKHFADIDAFPICLDHVHNSEGRTDSAKLIETTAALEPTFGGINLEDIGAPACFEVESELKSRMRIPVFHDDQHGTAIISLAGVLNALKIVGKKLEDVRIVVNGAGAAGIACAEFYVSAGAKRENVILCDTQGVIHQQRRQNMTEQKLRLAISTNKRTLEEAVADTDIFIGLSIADCLTPEMIHSMAKDPIIFAMANPDPEIHPDAALQAGAAVVGTGRTDFPNQVNNVLGFPGIFRGALDVRSSGINEEMKVAASRALAEIACEPIPPEIHQYLSRAYPQDAADGVFEGQNPLKPSYVIPKPFDPRVVPRVAKYVAQAARQSNVATTEINDWEKYEQAVARRTAVAQ